MGSLRTAVAVAAAAVLAAAATGCTVPVTGTAPPSPDPSAEAAATSAGTAAAPDSLAASPAAPVRLRYPRIGVDAAVSPTGLGSDGSPAVPPLDRAGEVDYLNWSGELAPQRPLVLLSHINGRDAAGHVIPGGFVHLAQAREGDEVTVDSATGASVRYRVVSVQTVPKTEFPASVYDPRPTATLFLITCGGPLDRAAHSFKDNVLVEATAV